MILVTVGAQLPFDRLIRAVDEWASLTGRTDVFGQIGDGIYCPKCIGYTRYVDPPEFEKLVEDAHLIVAHAGMGSIISALLAGKPVLVMPRRADLHEHRNDHQLATARSMQERGIVEVALDATILTQKLEELSNGATIREATRLNNNALTSHISRFISRA